MKYYKTAMIITQIVIYVLTIIAIYQSLKFIFGGSWELEGLIIVLLGINVTFTIKNSIKLSGHIGWHKGKGDSL